MSVTLVKGQFLTQDDLKIFIQDDSGHYFSPFQITYTIFRMTKYASFNTPSIISIDEEPILETVDTVPITFGIGKFFAAWIMPSDIEIGSFRIKWSMKKYYDSPIFDEVQEFEIIAPSRFAAEAAGRLPHVEYKGPYPG